MGAGRGPARRWSVQSFPESFEKRETPLEEHLAVREDLVREDVAPWTARFPDIHNFGVFNTVKNACQFHSPHLGRVADQVMVNDPVALLPGEFLRLGNRS